MKRYTLTIDTGKPYNEDYNTIPEVKTAIEQFIHDNKPENSPYCDIMLFDNKNDIIMNIDEVLKWVIVKF